MISAKSTRFRARDSWMSLPVVDTHHTSGKTSEPNSPTLHVITPNMMNRSIIFVVLDNLKNDQ